MISIHPFILPSASETVLPTTGTAELIINLAVFANALSAEAETSDPSPIIPEKTVNEIPSIHIAKFFIVFDISPILKSEIEPAIHKARYMQIKGKTISPESLEIKVTTESIRALKPVAAVIYPDAITAEE